MRVLLGLVVIAALIAGGFFYWEREAAKGIPADALEARYLTDADRFVTVDGVRVRVREEGPADAPVLILIHGFTVSLESWNGWADALSRDYRVIRYDMLGHGLTGPDPQKRYAIIERAGFLGALMDALGVERAALAGNSLGGGVAWRFAAANPERVDALVLVAGAAFPFNEVGDEPVTPNYLQRLYFRTAPEFMVAAGVEAISTDPEALPPGRADLLRDMMRREGNGQAFVDSVSEFVLPDPTAALARVRAPTLVMWGEGDTLLKPQEHVEPLVRALPDARAMIIENAGHIPHEDKPAETAAMARAFLVEAGVRG